MLMLLALYFLFPSRTNILVLGIDYTDPNNAVARSDTIILTTINPLQPYVGMLSIPRDLWVSIPGFGKHTDRKSTRLNSSHVKISYAVFCLKQNKRQRKMQ